MGCRFIIDKINTNSSDLFIWSCAPPSRNQMGVSQSNLLTMKYRKGNRDDIGKAAN